MQCVCGGGGGGGGSGGVKHNIKIISEIFLIGLVLPF